MTKYRITTPEPRFTGVSAGVNFTDSVAELEAPPPLEQLLLDAKELTRTERVARDTIVNDENYRKMAYFRSAGYLVEEMEDSQAADDDQPVKAPAKSASKVDWVAYAVSQGADPVEAEKATRDELATKYGQEGDQK